MHKTEKAYKNLDFLARRESVGFGKPSLDGDEATGFRFQLTFDRTNATVIEVEELTVFFIN